MWICLGPYHWNHQLYICSRSPALQAPVYCCQRLQASERSPAFSFLHTARTSHLLAYRQENQSPVVPGHSSCPALSAVREERRTSVNFNSSLSGALQCMIAFAGLQGFGTDRNCRDLPVSVCMFWLAHFHSSYLVRKITEFMIGSLTLPWVQSSRRYQYLHRRSRNFACMSSDTESNKTCSQYCR